MHRVHNISSNCPPAWKGSRPSLLEPVSAQLQPEGSEGASVPMGPVRRPVRTGDLTVSGEEGQAVLQDLVMVLEMGLVVQDSPRWRLWGRLEPLISPLFRGEGYPNPGSSAGKINLHDVWV